MGLEKLKEKPDELLNGRFFPHYRRCPVKEHLSEFCRLVCYLVNKKWLTDALSGASGSLAGMKSPMKADTKNALDFSLMLNQAAATGKMVSFLPF
ncbi:hypothetical protein OS493_032160 [Desmophyllum pertusum]|uniref:Uncharacterized protein n=1 Tax=Desmophyllum pertusum TaxID=174260 RepID=A0A9X0D6K3_9CNID|nr:hypothetical protein OS493_032160 [Desmophyllum pertusum]